MSVRGSINFIFQMKTAIGSLYSSSKLKYERTVSDLCSTKDIIVLNKGFT